MRPLPLLLCLAAALAAAPLARAAAEGEADTQGKGVLRQNEKPVFVQGALECKALQCNRLSAGGADGKVFVGGPGTDGIAYVSRRLIARNMDSTVITRSAAADVIRPSSGNVVFDANVQMNGNIIYGSTPMQLAAKNDSSILPSEPAVAQSAVGGGTAFLEEGFIAVRHSDGAAGDEEGGSDASMYQRQWRLVKHDHFSQGAVGWVWVNGEPAAEYVSHCGNGDLFLSAPCNAPAQNVSKLYTGLPPHTQLELQARVHFVDDWQGSVAFAKIDQDIVWVESHGSAEKQPPKTPPSLGSQANLCGSEQFVHDRLSVPVRVIVPHSSSSVRISFGSNILREGAQDCVASLGIDDVALLVH